MIEPSVSINNYTYIIIVKTIIISIPFWGILILFLFKHYEKIQALYGGLLSLFKVYKWCRKNSIRYTIEGNLNSFAKKLNFDSAEFIIPRAKIEFVDENNIESFISKGQPIIRMNFSRNNNENLVNATINYIKVALLDRSKNYIDREISDSVDLNVTRRMLLENKNMETISYFDAKYLIPEFDKVPNLRNYYEHVSEIDDAGFLTRLLLREYKDFGPVIYPAIPNDSHKLESKEFFGFVHTLSTRKKEEETPLLFNKTFIRLGIIFVAKTETYELFGIAAYQRRIRILVNNGVYTFYLFGRGDKHAEILNELRSDILKNSNFRELCYQKYKLKGITSCFSLIKLDSDAFRATAEKIIIDAIKNNNFISGVVVKVLETLVEVDINGVSVNVPLVELSNKTIIDARMYFKPEDDLKLRVVDFKNLNEIKLSNKGTPTDPAMLITKDYPVDKSMRGTVLKIIDAGLVLKLEDGMDGFVPSHKATFSRFARLDSLYKVGDVLDTKVLNFDGRYKSLVLSIAKLQDPWLDIKYRVGEIIKVQVCEISERKVVCELEPGIEGTILSYDLDWLKPDVNVLGVKVADIIQVRIKKIDLESRFIQLSKKEVLLNPIAEFFEKHKVDLSITAKIDRIIEGLFVEVVFSNSVKAIIYISELDWGYISNIQDSFPIGTIITVKLLSLDKSKNIILASRKQTINNPIDLFLQSYHIGDTVKGRIIEIGMWGAKVEIDNKFRNLNFFVVKGELSNLFYVDNANQILEQGAEYFFVIKNVDKEKQRILLSRKDFFNLVFDKQNFVYNESYKVKIIGQSGSGQYIVESNDSFQGILVYRENKAHKYKIILGKRMEVCIAGVNKQDKKIEAYLV